MPHAAVTACLALGSNLGDRAQALRLAAARLAAAPGVTLRAVAPAVETPALVLGPGGEPREDPAAPPYLNTVCVVETVLAPHALLALCHEIERAGGRDRNAEKTRWAPRVLDVDIVLYGQEVVDEPDLRIPHPEAHRRRFVLEPLAAVLPDARHPVLGKTIAELRAELDAHGD